MLSTTLKRIYPDYCSEIFCATTKDSKSVSYLTLKAVINDRREVGRKFSDFHSMGRRSWLRQQTRPTAQQAVDFFVHFAPTDAVFLSERPGPIGHLPLSLPCGRVAVRFTGVLPYRLSPLGPPPDSLPFTQRSMTRYTYIIALPPPVNVIDQFDDHGWVAALAELYQQMSLCQFYEYGESSQDFTFAKTTRTSLNSSWSTLTDRKTLSMSPQHIDPVSF